MTDNTQKVTPHLWFDDQAEEATEFYTAIFNRSTVGDIARYGDTGQDIHGQEPGTVMTVEFELEDQAFVALNGGPHFSFTPAVSFIVNCPTKEEVDELWNRLSKNGDVLMPLDSYPFSERYGWLQDQFGVSWQLIFADYLPERKIVPSLMFVGDQCGKAEEAIDFYTSIFHETEVGDIARYGPDQEPDEEGTVMFADFTLEGQRFAAMDSAQEHDFSFNEAISFIVECDDQEEVDYYWEKLSSDPEAEQCGWLKDKYGVSWQIVPTILTELLSDTDPEKVERVTDTFLRMKKLDIETLEKAYAGS